MKKQLLGFVLFFSLSLTAMDRFNRIRNISPTLSAILRRKFIDKQPLTKQQEAYLQKVKKQTLVAGLVALGVGAVTIAGYLAGRKRSTAQKEIKDSIKQIEEAGTPAEVSAILSDLAKAHFNGNLSRTKNYVEAQKPRLLERKEFTKEQYFEKIKAAEGIDVSFLLGDLANAYFYGNTVRAQNYVDAQNPDLLGDKGLKSAPF